MTWIPISGTPPQFTTSGEQAQGYVLKFYEIGTTTPLTVSSSPTGTPTTTDFLLDAQGYTTLSSTRVIPHVQTGYKIILYLNQTDADANDTGSAVWTIDNVTVGGLADNVAAVSNVTELAAVDVTVYTTAILKGTSSVDDGGQAVFYYDSTSTATENGTTVITPDSVGGGAGRWLILTWDTLSIGDSSVTTAKIADSSVTTAKIADRAITQAKHGWLPLTWVNGLTISNNSNDSFQHDIDIAAGQRPDDTQTYLLNCQAMTKQIDATWAQGTNAGGCSNAADSGVVQANTCYGVFALHKSSDPYTAATSDYIFAKSQANALADTNVVAAGYDLAILISAVVTDGSSNIIRFRDGGDGWQEYDVPIVTSITPDGSEHDVVVPVPPFMRGRFMYGLNDSSPTTVLGVLTQTDLTDTAPSTSNYDIYLPTNAGAIGGSVIKEVRVDGSRQVRHHEDSSNYGAMNGYLQTQAWKMDYLITDLV